MVYKNYSNTWCQHIGLNAREQLKNYRNSDMWLHNAYRFNSGYFFNCNVKFIITNLFNLLELESGYKIENKKKDLEILIANLLRNTKRPLRVPLNVNKWKKSRYNQSSSFTINIIKSLHRKNFINMKKGYNFQDSIPRETRIWATKKLLDYFPDYRETIRFIPKEVIVLRETIEIKVKDQKTKKYKTKKKKKDIEYKDTLETRRIRKILESTNKNNFKANIRVLIGNKDIRLNTSMRASFNGKLTQGGRLYSCGENHYQGLERGERPKITINGNKTIELDYKGLHPYLLYAAEGIQYKGDPYTVIDPHKELRPFLKKILICMINSNFNTAQGAANKWLLYKCDNHIRQRIYQLKVKKARPFMDKFIKVHEPISKYLLSENSIGLKLMNKDSKIALSIIEYFLNKKVPILCMHDSFIVEEQYKAELKQIMDEMYQKHTGGFKCEVK